MTRNMLILIVILLGGIFVYLASSFYTFNKEEVYYGKVTQKKEPVTLYSDEDQYRTNLDESAPSIKDGDWVKVTYTDRKGVLVEAKAINKKEIPTRITQKIERNE